MANYSAKVDFERSIVNYLNSKEISKNQLIGLTEKSIKYWAENINIQNSHLVTNYIIEIAKKYGFIIEESNSLRDFTNAENEIQTIKHRIEVLIM